MAPDSSLTPTGTASGSIKCTSLYLTPMSFFQCFV